MVTRAREGDTHPLQVSWLDELGRPLSVQNVVYQVFYFVGAVRTSLTDADLPMGATDQAYRFIAQYQIPEGLSGSTIYVECKSELVVDGSELIRDLVIQVDKPISAQKLSATF